MNWYDNQIDVLDFAKYLDERGEFDDSSAAIYFFEKPWKWNEEWKLFQEHQLQVTA